MKVRNGFVSNSSTSSFLIYGVSIEEDKLKQALLDVGVLKDEEKDEDGIDFYGVLDEATKGTNLEYHRPEGDDSFYVGTSWSSVGEDQTGKQFKEQVEEELKKKLGITVKCGTHEYAWRDG